MTPTIAVFRSSIGIGNYLTMDGVHPNPRGDQVIASAILTGFGLSAPQLAKAQATWQDIPGGRTVDLSYGDTNGKKNARNEPLNNLRAHVPLTIRLYEALNNTAGAHGRTGTQVLDGLYAADVRALLKPTGTYNDVDSIFDANQQTAVQKQLNDQIKQQIGQ